MKFIVQNPKSSKQLSSFEQENWLEAIKQVERDKQDYLDKKIYLVNVICQDRVCKWELTEETRKYLLRDNLLDESKRPSLKSFQ